MATNPKINLLRKVELEGKWHTLPVVRNKLAGGRISYDFSQVMFRKMPTPVDAGTFYLEYRDGSAKKKRRAVGSEVREVKAALATQQSVLALRKVGGTADDAPQIQARSAIYNGPTLALVAKRFKTSPPLKYRQKTLVQYNGALVDFTAFAGSRITHLVQVDAETVKDFIAWLVRTRRLETRTSVGKAIALVKVLRDAGATIVMKRGDWPRFTESQPTVYAPEMLDRLLAAANEDERDWIQTFLHTGMREQELVFLSWDDFDARRSMVHVRKKPGFDPKTYQERSIPIARGLVDVLSTRRERLKDAGKLAHLVFATVRTGKNRNGHVGDQADRKLLRKLKSLAYRGHLNCDRCRGTYLGKPDTCANAPICSEFGLHKFRHTYATMLLRDGIDLRSLQMLLGHNELASTEKYLRAMEPETLVERINRTQLATRFADPATLAPAQRRRRK